MISVKATSKKFWDSVSEGHIFFLDEDFKTASAKSQIETVEKDFYPNLSAVLKRHKFCGKVGQTFVLSAMKNEKLVVFIFIGIGNRDKKWDVELELLRRAVGSAVLCLKNMSVESAVLALPESDLYKISAPELLKEITIAAHLAIYEFADFKTKKEKAEIRLDIEVVVGSDAGDLSGFETAANDGSVIGAAVNYARLLSDRPANILTPTEFSKMAQKDVADAHGLKCSIFGKDRAQELGMGAFLAVGQGSDQDEKFVILEYKSEKSDAKTIALVGKGVTFDSGGVSLKPSNAMTGMKFDMSGAASVLGTMKAVAQWT